MLHCGRHGGKCARLQEACHKMLTRYARSTSGQVTVRSRTGCEEPVSHPASRSANLWPSQDTLAPAPPSSDQWLHQGIRLNRINPYNAASLRSLLPANAKL